MALRMTGLNSGLDTESIIASLMEAHKAKKTKVDNKKTTLEWKQEIWKDLNKKLYSFYTDFAGKLRFQSNYMTKKVSSANSSKVTGTASATAASGSYSVKVNKLASTQNVTSAKLGKYQPLDMNGSPQVDKEGNVVAEKEVTGTTRLAELGMVTDGSSQIQIETGKKTVIMTVNNNTTVNDFVTNLKNAGLNASFDEKQGRFFIGSTTSGKDQSFKITTNTLDTSAGIALGDIYTVLDYSSLSASNQNTITSALDTMQNSIIKNGYTQEAVDAATKKIEDMLDANEKKAATKKYTDQLTEKYALQYVSSADEDGKVTGLTSDGIQALKDAEKYVDPDEEVNKALKKDPTLTQEKQDEIREEANKKNYKAAEKLMSDKVAKDLKTDEYKDKIAQDVQDAKDARGTSTSTTLTNYANALAAGGAVNNSTGSSAELQKLGLDIITGAAVAETSAGQGMVVIEAADSEVELNGATLTSSTTTLDVSGLTLNLTGVTDEAVTVTVTNDTQGVYDMIKEFINQYNSILKEMDTMYNAKSARGYDPLTSEQKDEMSDDEIEKWEKKIKDSLLRRDSTLQGLVSTFRSITATSIKASNGKTYSLVNLGITTGKDYKEHGLLHIKGDEDDTDYADDDNTLMSLLNEDPSVVTEVLAGITNQLYNTLTKKMQTSSLSSALTFYNDKEMNKQLSDYNKDIKKWETKLKDIEDRYYKQFTAMEKALASLQSQQSALSGFFGV